MVWILECSYFEHETPTEPVSIDLKQDTWIRYYEDLPKQDVLSVFVVSPVGQHTKAPSSLREYVQYYTFHRFNKFGRLK